VITRARARETSWRGFGSGHPGATFDRYPRTRRTARGKMNMESGVSFVLNTTPRVLGERFHEAGSASMRMTLTDTASGRFMGIDGSSSHDARTPSSAKLSTTADWISFFMTVQIRVLSYQPRASSAGSAEPLDGTSAMVRRVMRTPCMFVVLMVFVPGSDGPINGPSLPVRKS
jgi:hypothetical protein